jgi:hypothetical protein
LPLGKLKILKICLGKDIEMTKEKSPKGKESFFKNPWNIVFLAAIIGILVYAFTVKDDYDRTTADRVWDKISRGEAGNAIQHTIETGIQKITCVKRPPTEEVEAYYKDNAGSIPVAADFDIDEGEICGNGKKYYCTSKPPKKAIPSSWTSPPRVGSDPDYQGPQPGEPFKESPYAMPSPKITLVRSPIVDLRDSALNDEVKRSVARAAGKIGYIGPRDPAQQFPEFGPHIKRLDESMFITDDDSIPGKQLLAKGIDFVMIDRTAPFISPWIEEKMSTVLVRLRDAVSLSWFHPVVLGSGYALFRVAEPFTIPRHVKRRLTSRVRAQLMGETPVDFEFAPSNAPIGDDSFRVIVSLRWRGERGLKGRKLTKEMAHSKTLLGALDRAAVNIRKEWPSIVSGTTSNRTISVSSVPADIKEAVSKMEIEIDVLYDMCALVDRSPRNMLWYLELGLEGVSLRGNDRFHYLEPSYAVHMEMTSSVVFLEKMLMKGKLKQFLRPPKQKRNRKRGQVLFETPWRTDKKYRFGRFRTVNWIEKPEGGDIVELYRGVPLKTIWDVTRAALVKSLELGAQWLMTNQADDGQYAYKYTPTNKPGKRWTAGGNIVRHALNPYTLLMVNKIAPRPEYVASARKGTEFTLNFLRREGNRCVICHRDPPARYYNAKIGTVAVTILSILKLGDVADISDYDDVLKCLAEELMYMQDPNGHFRQYDVPEDHPYYGAESTIAPGEFVFALSRLYSHYKDARYKEAVDRALPWYMKAWRKLLDERTPHGVYDEEHRVNLIGIVPWLVTAMNDLHQATGEQRYADIAFEQQEWIDKEFFWYPKRAEYPDYVGASFKVHRELPAINSCQYTEGAAAAYDLAKRVGHDEEARRKLLVHGMRFCLQTQYDSYESTFFLPVPEEAMGGYRYTLGHLRLRNDYNYHAMAAIAQGVDYLEPDDYPAERPMRIPPVLSAILGDVPNPEADTPRRPRGTPLEEEVAATPDAGVQAPTPTPSLDNAAIGAGAE